MSTALTIPADAFTIPEDELVWFTANVPETADKPHRTEVFELLEAMRMISEARNVTSGCRAAAALFHGRRGFKERTLKNKWQAFSKSWNWRELLDKAKCGPKFWESRESVGLPREFVEFVRMWAEKKNGNEGGIREVLLIWRTGHDSAGERVRKIPGYGDAWPTKDAATGRPRGWSNGNLQKQMASRLEITAARIGPIAARRHLPPVQMTRAGLELLERVEFDDHEFDLKVNWPGNSRAMRPRGFFAIDVLSGHVATHMIRPTLWVEDKTGQRRGRKDGLKETEFRWMAVEFLCGIGFRDDERGTTLVGEHGTARFPEWFAERIHRVTGGKVNCIASGHHGKAKMAGRFDGAMKGNPRFKAHIEQWFRTLNGYLSALPAQVGQDRLHAPEEAEGLERYNERLLKVAERRPELAELLKHPNLSWTEFGDALRGIMRLIAEREEHSLEGWEECGHVVKEWRLTTDSEWLPMSALDNLAEPQRGIASAMIAADSRLSRVRRLSPLEAWRAGQERNGIRQLSPALYPQLLGPESAERRRPRTAKKLDQCLFQFSDKSISPEPLKFLAIDEGGEPLPDREFLTYLNPMRPDFLVVTDRDGRLAGMCPRWNRNPYSDQAGINRQMGIQKAIESAAFRNLGIRHRDDAGKKLAMHKRNADVMTGRIAPPEDNTLPDGTATTENDDDQFAALDLLKKASGGNH